MEGKPQNLNCTNGFGLTLGPWVASETVVAATVSNVLTVTAKIGSRMRLGMVAAVCALSLVWPIHAQSGSTRTSEDSGWIQYSREGLSLQAAEERFTALINLRGQFRFSSPFETTPRTLKQINREPQQDLRLRRARLKAAGQLGKSWLRYDYEQDLTQGRLLDLWLDVGPEWLRLRTGQWKAEYSRERVDSSGEQQLVDRSIANRAFTIDRQKGAMAFGRVWKEKLWHTQYFAGVFAGHGRSLQPSQAKPGPSESGQPMWLARYQWNPLGGGVPFSQGDLDRSKELRLSLAVAASGNRSRYTRFSAGGGGQLEGFEAGAPGQYSISQQTQDVAFQYRGFSAQQEWHWKRVLDHASQCRTRLMGGYFQAGFFPSEILTEIPKSLEIAGRVALVDNRRAIRGESLHSVAIGLNWYFEGHRNKLSVDGIRYRLRPAGAPARSAMGVRVQWDLTL